ncbi:hypothetical protein Tco_0047117 [Tanacetum coccineum]
MDLVIPLGQKNTLAEYMILSSADNRPPMLDKDLYDSWKSRMELYIQNREHGRRILKSVENGPLIWPTVEDNGVTKTKKYDELVAKDLWERVQLLMQGTSLTKHERKFSTQPVTESPLEDSGFVVPVFSPVDDPIACEGHMARQCTQPKRPRNTAWYKEKSMLAEAQEAGQILDEEQLIFLADPWILDGQVVQTIIPNNAIFQTEDLNTYDSDCDDLSNVQAVLMVSISNYGSDVISKVPHSKTYLNDMVNQSVHAMQNFEQPPVVDFTDNEIHSGSNIIPYSQYLQETQQQNVQDTHLQAQQDSMILFVIEQMLKQIINHVNNWEKVNKEHNNESVTAELERYKERLKTFEQRLNIDLSSREKIIDSQIDDMIREKLALKEQVDSLEQNLSKQIKENECLLQTFSISKQTTR